ncbi:MAG: hypothetical protein ACWGO2_09035 [Syntrophobacteria bacterium]
MRCEIPETIGKIPHLTSHILHSFVLRLFRALVAAVICAALAVNPNMAWALVGDTESSFGLDGRLSTTNLFIDNYDFEPFFGDSSTDQTSQNVLRLIAAGRPTEQLNYEVHGVQSYTYSTTRRETGASIFGTSGTDSRYRALDATWDWYDGSKSSASLWLDRFNLKATLAKADITAGRQPITFGKAYFWNPLDIFLSFDPRQFDRDYKAGVDALRMDIPLGSFTGINLIGVAGRELDSSGGYVDHGTLNASWYGSALLGRTFTTLHGWDLAIQGGKTYGGYQLGTGLVGEIGPIEARAEASYFWARDSEPLPAPLAGDLVEDAFTAVVGFGHRFDNTLTVEIEYFYNGAGESDDLEESFVRFRSGSSLQMSHNVTGFLISYEFEPIIIGQFTALYSWDDPSAQIQPILTWSPSDNTEVLVGASINFGDRPTRDSSGQVQLRSEFGTFPDFYFMQFKLYF